jgi:hypothetical protein
MGASRRDASTDGKRRPFRVVPADCLEFPVTFGFLVLAGCRTYWPDLKFAVADYDLCTAEPKLQFHVVESLKFKAPLGRVMSSAKFREYADECMDWAKSAKTDRERKIFLEMAATWLDAATRSEMREREPVARASLSLEH